MPVMESVAAERLQGEVWTSGDPVRRLAARDSCATPNRLSFWNFIRWGTNHTLRASHDEGLPAGKTPRAPAGTFRGSQGEGRR